VQGEFGQYVFDVDRAQADAKQCGDGGVVVPGGQMDCDFGFPRRESAVCLEAQHTGSSRFQKPAV
jgi:hypothetical protein